MQPTKEEVLRLWRAVADAALIQGAIDAASQRLDRTHKIVVYMCWRHAYVRTKVWTPSDMGWESYEPVMTPDGPKEV